MSRTTGRRVARWRRCVALDWAGVGVVETVVAVGVLGGAVVFAGSVGGV
jgi:hypothetical protein